MFIHRQDYYGLTTEENPGVKGLTDIIIAKHRNGAVCDVQMRFRSSEVRFVEMTETVLSSEYASGPGKIFGSKMNSEEFKANSDFDS
jgi:replicative DNA helicase